MQTLQPHAVLAQHPVFAQSSGAARRDLAAALSVQTHAAGEVLTPSADVASVWLLAWGRAERVGDEGRAAEPLMTGELFDATVVAVRALSPIVVYALPRAALERAGLSPDTLPLSHSNARSQQLAGAAALLQRTHARSKAAPSFQTHGATSTNLFWALLACAIFGLGGGTVGLMALPCVDHVWSLRDTTLLPALALSMVLAAAAQLAAGHLSEPLLRAALAARRRRGVLGALLASHGPGVARTIAVLAVHGLLLLWVCAHLAMVSFAAAVLGTVLLARLGRRVGRGYASLARCQRSLMAHAQDAAALLAAPLGRVARDRLQQWGARKLRAVGRRGRRLGSIATRLRAASRLAQTLHLMLLLALGLFWVRSQEISLGQLVAGALLADGMWGAAVTLLGAYLQGLAQASGRPMNLDEADARTALAPYSIIAQLRTAIRRLVARLLRRRARLAVGTPRDATGLRLVDVTHHMPHSERNILEHLRLEIDRGERVGIWGGTGAGKSLLARLCSGELRPTHGSVRYRGIDVSTVDHRMVWRARTDLRGTTLLDALCVDAAAPALDLAQAAARIVGLDAKIEALPDGFATPLASLHFCRADVVRAALARALTACPHVLILDDIFADVDRLTAVAMYDQLSRYLPGCAIVLLSTHRGGLLGSQRALHLSHGALHEESAPELAASAGLELAGAR